jgi:hypothetical protein
LENKRAKKIPRLVALVKAVVPTDADLKVTLRDPTGEIDGALQRKAIELHPSIISGAVIVLEQVCVLDILSISVGVYDLLFRFLCFVLHLLFIILILCQKTLCMCTLHLRASYQLRKPNLKYAVNH